MSPRGFSQRTPWVTKNPAEAIHENFCGKYATPNQLVTAFLNCESVSDLSHY
jgi:hypothetical protein